MDVRSAWKSDVNGADLLQCRREPSTVTSAVDLRYYEGIVLVTTEHSAAEGAIWQGKYVAGRSEVRNSRSDKAFDECLMPTEAG